MPSFVERVEDDVRAISDTIAQDIWTLMQEMGDRKAFAVPRPSDLQALQNLPHWFVYLNAEPLVSGPAWDIQLGIVPDPETGVAIDPEAGARMAYLFDRDMRALFDRYPSAVVDGIEPEMREEYRLLRQQGLHLGRVKPPLAEYLDIPTEEDDEAA
jgi:hypothetical protein